VASRGILDKVKQVFGRGSKSSGTAQGAGEDAGAGAGAGDVANVLLGPTAAAAPPAPAAAAAPTSGNPAVQAARSTLRDAAASLDAPMAAMERAQKSGIMLDDKEKAVSDAIDALESASQTLASACMEAKSAGSLEGAALRIWALGKAEATEAKSMAAQMRKETGIKGAAPASAPAGGLPKPSGLPTPVAKPAPVSGAEVYASRVAEEMKNQRLARAAAMPKPGFKDGDSGDGYDGDVPVALVWFGTIIFILGGTIFALSGGSF